MIKVTKVTTSYSEKAELNDREWANTIEFDTELIQLMADHSVTDLSYHKTDITVTWDDGETTSFRLDANRINNLATEFQNRYRFYCGHNAQRPEWMTLKQWHQATENYTRFFETYAIN